MMDFSGFEADSQQLDNVAGLRRMWKVRAKSFVGEYPAKADIVDGEITVSPTVRLPAYFMPAQYEMPQNTAMYSDVLAGNRGFQAYRHVVGYQMAGLSKGLLKELLKDINAGAVYFMEDTNGNINVAGSSKKGLPLNTTGSSGKDGSEQRGKVMAAEEVGFRWPVMPLSVASGVIFFRRLLGYSEVRSLSGFQSPITPNTSMTIVVADYKAFQVGDRVNVRGYTDNTFTTPSQGPFPGTITIIASAFTDKWNVAILGDNTNTSSIQPNTNWKILKITENGNL